MLLSAGPRETFSGQRLIFIISTLFRQTTFCVIVSLNSLVIHSSKTLEVNNLQFTSTFFKQYNYTTNGFMLIAEGRKVLSVCLNASMIRIMISLCIFSFVCSGWWSISSWKSIFLRQFNSYELFSDSSRLREGEHCSVLITNTSSLAITKELW